MATAKIVLDKRKPATSGEQSYYVKVRITHNRSSRYYPTQHKKDAKDGGKEITNALDLNRPFTDKEFSRIIDGRRRTDTETDYNTAFELFRLRAQSVINKTDPFTFEEFEKAYIKNLGITDSVKAAYDEKIKQMKDAGQIGNAVNYQCAIASLEKYKSGLKFIDVTPDFLKAYDKNMREPKTVVNEKTGKVEEKKGASATTISMYLRTLRTVFNEMIFEGLLEPTLYPFSKGESDKKKYSPPSAKNIKKALKPEHLASLYYYESEVKALQQAKDFWTFSYLANGMSMKDVVSLKRSDIDGEFLRYERAKTRTTKGEATKITVHIKDEMKAIIRKYSIPSINKDAYIFPVLNKDMTPEEQYMKIQNFTHFTNKKLRLVCKELGIPPATTYSARHSFAHTLKVNGKAIEFIRDAMGHSSSTVTKNYLDSFEDAAIKKETDVLIPIRKAN